MTTVTQFTTLITAATTPVLFSALSRLQNNKEEFEAVFLKFQRLVGLLIIPMSIGMFLYRDFLTRLLLGDQWLEATTFIGLWGLTSSLGILLNNYCSEAYRALGKPKISLFVQIVHLVFLVPALTVSAQKGFEALYWTRSMIRFQMYITQLLVLYYITKISFVKIVRNLFPSIVGGICMGLLAIGLQRFSIGMIWSFFSILVCALFYGCIILLFPRTRKECFAVINPFIKKVLSN